MDENGSESKQDCGLKQVVMSKFDDQQHQSFNIKASDVWNGKVFEILSEKKVSSHAFNMVNKSKIHVWTRSTPYILYQIVSAVVQLLYDSL